MAAMKKGMADPNGFHKTKSKVKRKARTKVRAKAKTKVISKKAKKRGK